MANKQLQYTAEKIDELLEIVDNLGEATTEDDGLMSSSDKAKLDGIEQGAEANVIAEVQVGGTTISPVNKVVNVPADAAPTENSTNLVRSGGVYAALASIQTSLLNYYTKAEVDALIAGIKQFSYQVVAELPTASADTMFIVYLVPAPSPEAQNIKDEYITIRSGSEGAYTYSWEQIGSTAIDLSDYSTTAEMNAAIAAALEDYTTTAILNTLLSAKADKDASATEGHLAEFDAAGQVRDAGVGLDGIAAPFAADIYDNRSAGTPQSFVFRQSGGDGVNFLRHIKGRTLVWNQCYNADSATRDLSGVTVTALNGKVTISGTPSITTNTGILAAQDNTATITGHKYLVVLTINSITGATLRIYNGTATAAGSITASTSMIFTASGSAGIWLGCGLTSGTNISAEFYFYAVDLTLMFGAGNEPATAEEFRAVYRLPYFAYTPALMKNNAATDLESTGFNQWDEEWELGTISTTTGEKVNSSTSIRAKNDIAVFPNTAYFYCQPGSKGQPRLAFLDANHETISVVASGLTNNIFTTPANCRYIRFSSHTTLYGTTYNNDICINLSDTDRNGTYEPYWKATRHLGLDSIQAKEVGTDTIVTINGLDGVGDNVDLLKEGKTLIKNRARVDLGSLTWNKGWYTEAGGWRIYCSIQNKANGLGNLVCSRYAYLGEPNSSMSDKSITGNIANSYIYIKDSSYSGSGADALIASLSGVILDYPLATPKEYELVEPIQPMLEVDELGTERRLPEDTAAAVNAPFESDSNYSVSVRKLTQFINNA